MDAAVDVSEADASYKAECGGRDEPYYRGRIASRRNPFTRASRSSRQEPPADDHRCGLDRSLGDAAAVQDPGAAKPPHASDG